MEEINLIKQFENLGVCLIETGSEIARVENGLTRILVNYGYKNISVFALPSYLIITVSLKDGTVYTTSKNTDSYSTDFDRFASLNQLLRDLESKKLTSHQICDQMNRIKSTHHAPLGQFIAYGFAALGFTGLFGGGTSECIGAFVIGLSVFVLNNCLIMLKINRLVRTFIGSAFIAICSHMFKEFGLINNVDTIQIGSLMLLVPGLAITNSLRDFIDEDYLSGVSRIIEALMTAISIALGVGVVLGVIS